MRTKSLRTTLNVKGIDWSRWTDARQLFFCLSPEKKDLLADNWLRRNRIILNAWLHRSSPGSAGLLVHTWMYLSLPFCCAWADRQTDRQTDRHTWHKMCPPDVLANFALLPGSLNGNFLLRPILIVTRQCMQQPCYFLLSFPTWWSCKMSKGIPAKPAFTERDL